MLFGTSGIRGVVGKEITCELALAAGKALGEMNAENARAPAGKGNAQASPAAAAAAEGMVAIGRDSRKSGVMLENALVSGILSSGGSVGRLGIAPTPTVAFASKKKNCFGIMITASHNPPEYNGFKFFENGNEAGRQFEKNLEEKITRLNTKKTLEHAIATQNKKKNDVNYGVKGKDFIIDDAIREHSDFVLKNVDVEAIKRKNPKVIVDCGNGAGGAVTPFVLREAGCRVVSVNAEPSGVFARRLEPNEENLRGTAGIVAATGALLGIAHDGDADRAIGIDETGKVLGLDEQLVLFCEDVLNGKKGKIVSTVEASLCVREAVEANGGELLITRVGSRDVSEELRKSNAVFGGEPCGEYVYPGELTIPDGIRTALKLVEIACKKGKLSTLASKIKKYPIKRAKIPCANEKKKEAMQRIAGDLASVVKGKTSTIDGVRVDFEGGWLLVRPSGTEPFIRITCEAKEEKKLREAFEKAEKTVKKNVA